jgi:hypothetical protein
MVPLESSASARSSVRTYSRRWLGGRRRAASEEVQPDAEGGLLIGGQPRLHLGGRPPVDLQFVAQLCTEAAIDDPSVFVDDDQHLQAIGLEVFPQGLDFSRGVQGQKLGHIRRFPSGKK